VAVAVGVNVAVADGVNVALAVGVNVAVAVGGRDLRQCLHGRPARFNAEVVLPGVGSVVALGASDQPFVSSAGRLCAPRRAAGATMPA